LKRDRQTLGEMIAPGDRTMPPRSQVVGHGFLAASALAFLWAGWQTAKRERDLLIRASAAAAEAHERTLQRETVAVMTAQGAVCFAGFQEGDQHPAGSRDDCPTCLKYRAVLERRGEVEIDQRGAAAAERPDQA
jgi:hypothetical protein